MEELTPQSLPLAALAVALLLVLKVVLKPTRGRAPPGPWKLPVIGSLHHLVNVLPHRALRDLANAHGPLMMLQLGRTSLLVASSKEAARLVLKTHDTNFATRPRLLAGEIVSYGWTDIVFSPTGEYWRKLRQLCTSEILSPKRVLSFRHIREDEVRMQVEQIRASTRPVNLSLIFHDVSNSIVARAAIGKKPKKAAELISTIKAVVGLASGLNIPDLFPTLTTLLAAVSGMKRTLQSSHKTLDSILQEIIDDRKRKLARAAAADKVQDENLLDVLIGVQQQKGGGYGFGHLDLDDRKIKAIILNMFAAGTGTSGSAMEWVMSELMHNPRVMEKLQGQIREAFKGKAVVTESDLQLQGSDLHYLKLVIKEALRMHPPVPLLVPRESMDECELDGYRIPAKSRVVVNAWAIGRDPRYWDEPDEFRPERFQDSTVDFVGRDYELLPFGAGRRMCPGFNFALATMELALLSLLYHFDWSLPEGVAEVNMDEAPGLGVRRRWALLLLATPFVPTAV